MCSQYARSSVCNADLTDEELVYLAKIAIKMDRRIRSNNQARAASQLSQIVKSRRNWLALFVLVNSFEKNIDSWYKPEDFLSEYDKHMGIVKISETETLSDKDQTYDSSLKNYHLHRGLSFLSKEINMENEKYKKNIRTKSNRQSIHYNGFPSAWKFPKGLKGIQDIINSRPGALERLKRGLDLVGVSNRT